jgi:peptide/nickel transport system substrate-binding protein
LFSDGEPFNADDVLFTFEVLMDPAIGSPQRDMLSPDGEPVRVEKIDSHTVHFRLEQALAVGLLMFEGLSILPEHLLRPIYERGEIAEAWNIGTSPEEMAGLGPFRLREYQPAARVVLERNPHYWRTDSEGLQLPYLAELSLEITGSGDAELLRFEAGASHIVQDLTAENFDLLTREGLQRVDAGAGFAREILVWNLNDLSSRDLPEIERHQSWIRQRSFRQAISKAIDRAGIIGLVYGGKAAPLAANVSPGNEKWLNRKLPPPELDVEAARALLKSAGFERRGDRLLDSRGEAVALTLLTSSTNQRKEKMGAIIRQDLLRLGIEIRLVPLDQAGLIDRLLNTFEYDATLLTLGDGDPNAHTNILASNGGTHIWDMQPTQPLSDWQLEIDSLMMAQRVEMSFAKRKGMWDRVQEILSAELPVIELVSSHILAAAQPEVGGFEPARVPHYTLWNAERLYLRE